MIEKVSLQKGNRQMIKPLQKHTIVDDIINALFQMIDSGYFKPGQKLPSERDLSLKLDALNRACLSNDYDKENH